MKSRKWRTDAKTVLFTFSVIVSLLITFQSLRILIVTKLGESQPATTPVATTTQSSDVFSSTQKLYSFKGEKLVHVDLKGAPPLLSYFKRFFPYISDLGATGVLIEYEDMFPYKDGLENITAKNCYSPKDVKTILKSAEDSNLMVVPSIQVLGHLEFVLKLKEFKDLREISEYPETLCPSNREAFALVKKMIDQVLKAHPAAKYIHIGCGEVQYLGICDKCRITMSQRKLSPPELYLRYLRRVAAYINETYPGVRPIVWGDIVSKLNKQFILQSQIYNMVDLMVSVNSPNVTEVLTDKMLLLYSSVFKNIWIASAFKGATGANQRVNEITFHLENHISWMGVVEKWRKLINFKGIVLTGRQRYTHFAELCELLPVALPSLTVNLNYLNNFESVDINSGENILQCDHSLPPSRRYFSSKPECNFPGLEIYQVVRKFETFYKNLRTSFSLADDGEFTVYNIVHKFISPVTVRNIFENLRLEENLSDLMIFEDELITNLVEVYDYETVQEWVQTYVKPARIKLEALTHIRDALLEVETWPRRPLGDSDLDLAEEAKKVCDSDRKLDCLLFFV